MVKKDPVIEMPSENDVSRYGGDSEAQPPIEDAAPLPVEEIDAVRRELDECKDKLLRAQAECANISRRLHQQQVEAVRYATMGLARDVLHVLDSFDRSLQNMETAQADKAMLDGVRLIADQLDKVLKDHGITPIEAEGRAFDPTIHEAMMSDTNSDAAPGTVTRELVRGYMMNDRVLRPAKVMVAAGGDESHAA